MSAVLNPTVNVDTFDIEVILKEIGSFGKFQIINYVLISYIIFLTTPNCISYLFSAGDLNYRCEIPSCDNSSSEYNPEWLQNAVPFTDGVPSQCERYEFSYLNNSICGGNNFNKSVILPCDKFIYENEEKTILNEWNLTCPENKWKLTSVGTINIFGQFFCLSVTGLISDRFGRRVVLIFGLIGAGIFGILRSFSWSYLSFVSFEFLESVFASGVYGTSFVLGVELVGQNYRIIGGSIISTSFAIGEVLLGYVAMLAQDWRIFLRFCYGPAFSIIPLIYIIPESVRWLHTKGRKHHVSKFLKLAADTNNVKLSDSTTKILQQYEEESVIISDKIATDVEKLELKNRKLQIFEIFKSSTIMIRLAISAFIWATNTFVYYGLSLHSVSFGGDKYVNFMLISIIEVPGYIGCWFYADRIGRRLTLSGSLLLSGISCIISPFVEHIHWLSLICFLIGKFAITVSFTTLYVYTAEIFPTNIRNSMLGISSTFGRFGNMVAPQVPLLAIQMKSLPMFLFGGVSVFAGLIGTHFPETLNKTLPDTLEEAVKMDKRIGHSPKK